MLFVCRSQICVAQRKEHVTAALLSCPAQQAAHTNFLPCHSTHKKPTRGMNNSAHKLLDELLDEVKRSLIDQQIDKFKTEIFDKVEKQQKAVLEDVMQICDRIYKEVLAAAGQMIENGKQELLISKQELLDNIHAMVAKEVKLQLKMEKDKEKDKDKDKEKVEKLLGEDTQPPRQIFFRTGMFEEEVYSHMERQKQEQEEEESQSLLAMQTDNDDLMN